MPAIHVLEKQIAELIAAGEVIDRPASVIKELAENAIDAGATLVVTEIKNGGVTYMRMSDNGCGIAAEDLPRAFLRHATSKVLTRADLEGIGSLGFRGEALASIAAMCKVEILSREESAETGARYCIEGGEEQDFAEAGCPRGTTIVVRDIFYNTPARMKFLKKDSTEGAAVASVLEKLALSHPEISFKLIRDGEVKLQTPGNADLRSAIHAVFGGAFAATLAPVQYEHGGLRLTGFISRPTECRANRTMQNFFVNNRYIRSRTCMAALEEAYRHSIMVGKFPACILNVQLPPRTVDVNVHPAKLEVRFADEKTIFDLIYYGVKSALSSLDREGHTANLPPAQPSAREPQRISAADYRALAAGAGEAAAPCGQGRPYAGLRSGPPTPVLEAHSPRTAGYLSHAAAPLMWEEAAPAPPSRPAAGAPAAPVARTFAHPAPAGTAPQPSQPATGAECGPALPQQAALAAPARFADARLLGELFGTYLLLESEERLILIDKHAAHERLLFERLRSENEKLDRQTLLTPVVVTLAREEHAAVLEQLPVLERIGLLVEDFGGVQVVVREIPVMLRADEIPAVVSEAAARLLEHKKDMTPGVLDDLLHSIACRGAIKAHDPTSPQELAALVRLLQEHEEVRFCPHGRPIATVIPKGQIEKMFGRA